MKCPIFIIGRMNSSDPSDISYTDCLKTLCAVWDKEQNACPITVISHELKAIHAKLGDIASKMPFKATL